MRREGYNSVTKLRLRKSAFDKVRRAVKSSSSSFSSSIYQGFRGRGRERGRRTALGEPAYRAEISSIRSIGRRARFKISAGNSMRGASFFMQSRTFSSVFNFMYLHSLQRQLSDGIRITSNTGAHRNSLPGHSFCIRWMMPDSVTMTNRFAGLVLAVA